MEKLEVEIEWRKKKLFYPIMIKFYEMLRVKPDDRNQFIAEHPELYNENYIYYLFSFEDQLLYLGKTAPEIPVYDRLLNNFHDGLRKILLNYPNPTKVTISCASIEKANVPLTEIVLLDLENTLIYESKPEFNIYAKYSYDNKFDEYQIKNIGDCSPLKSDYKWKDKERIFQAKNEC